MSDFLEAVRLLFPPVLSGHLASRSGESVNGMKRGLQGAVPLVLMGLIASASTNEQGCTELCRRAHRPGPGTWGGVTGILITLGSKDAPDSVMMHGRYLLETAFASSEEVVSTLSRYARIRLPSARTILELVGAVLLGAMHQRGAGHPQKAAQVITDLRGLKSRVRAMLPPELRSLATVLDAPRPVSWSIDAAGSRRVAGSAPELSLPARWYKVVMVMLAIAVAGIAAAGALRPAPRGPAAPAVATTAADGEPTDSPR